MKPNGLPGAPGMIRDTVSLDPSGNKAPEGRSGTVLRVLKRNPSGMLYSDARKESGLGFFGFWAAVASLEANGYIIRNREERKLYLKRNPAVTPREEKR